MKEAGLDLAHFLGQPFSPRRTDGYRIGGEGFRDELPVMQQLEVVHIVRALQFGNAVQQLLNAFDFCRLNGVPELWHEGFEWSVADITIEGVRIRRRPEPAAAEIRTLAGMFFYRATLSPVCRWQSRFALMQRLIDGWLFDRAIGKADPADVLYVHLRSGDIFRGDGVNREYGQPPLAFYRKVLALGAWRKAVLVYEDEGNPCIGALGQLLREKGIPFETCSGSLRHDVERLYHAQALVIGRGSFAMPIVCTSPNLRTLYLFQEDRCGRWGVRDLEVHRFEARSPEYVNVLTNWTNAPAQRQMMLDYPEADIASLPVTKPEPALRGSALAPA